MTRRDYKKSVSEKGDAARGSTTSLGSTLSSRATSRSSSVGPENGDIDYKKLYEEQLTETHRVNERLRGIENELRQSRESIDLSTKKLMKQENQRLKDENGALIRVIIKSYEPHQLLALLVERPG
ncbi:hypothetical protein E2C01_003575 [Portunus trituberculatus]|uniref:cGMP-dependent protein kinase interacting domain-containing protein n=1 Tax=Portunus trituberculatus TaxID=210409 RepID=A0A5B7CN51_PORTR|nr:hypothetical protein [Portunus trituberculatus]